MSETKHRTRKKREVSTCIVCFTWLKYCGKNFAPQKCHRNNDWSTFWGFCVFSCYRHSFHFKHESIQTKSTWVLSKNLQSWIKQLSVFYHHSIGIRALGRFMLQQVWFPVLFFQWYMFFINWNYLSFLLWLYLSHTVYTYTHIHTHTFTHSWIDYTSSLSVVVNDVEKL